jgi:hypothetical protein
MPSTNQGSSIVPSVAWRCTSLVVVGVFTYLNGIYMYMHPILLCRSKVLHRESGVLLRFIFWSVDPFGILLDRRMSRVHGVRPSMTSSLSHLAMSQPWDATLEEDYINRSTPRRKLGFLDLPAEIRVRIYEDILDDLLQLSRTFRGSRISMMRAQSSLPYACRQIRMEVNHHFRARYLGLMKL